MDKIVIFCSASNDAPAKFNESAYSLVSALCAKGYGIVSGGSFRGTMGYVAKAVVDCGGFHKGVLPRFMAQFAFDGLSETIWTETMAERKEEMRRGSIAAIAFPGGIGTLDEIIETHVLKKLGRYHGRVIVFNPDGFFGPFLSLLDHYVSSGMLTPKDRALVEVFDTEEALLASF